MAMSRKHYTEVAEIVKANLAAVEASNDEDRESGATVLRNVANDLAGFFKRDNSSFDRQRFLNACGL